MSPRRVLVVDDEPAARLGLKSALEAQGYVVDVAGDGAQALDRVAELPPDAVLTDLDMPRMNGQALIAALRERDRTLPVIVTTSATELRVAVEAMAAGAVGYLPKPVDLEELALTLRRAIAQRDVHLENEALRRQLHERHGDGLQGLLGASAAMQTVYRLARQVAPARATVLITGESGTGKGLLAPALHAMSPRADQPFVAVHCAALAESVLESELFGHEKGAFTGADRQRVGRFEQAHGGTLFLDEIGEISPALQVKLLTVLQERRFERVGGNQPLTVDVRLIAATNRDLARDVKDGRFREDLFYRLNVVHIEMPPLRQRAGDVLALADHFLGRFARENAKRLDGFTDAARARLAAHPWPGNVRELENAIERAVVLCEGARIDVDLLPEAVTAPTAGGELSGAADLPGLAIPGATMAEVEHYAIVKTLEAVGGSTARAAELLGLSVRTIQYRLNQYGLMRDRPRGPVLPSRRGS